MTWSTSNCIDYYTVTVSNGSSVVVQTHTTNLTSILINGLQQGTNYSFTVKAVDGIGREGNTSEYVTLLLDGKLFKTLKTIIIVVIVPDEIQNISYTIEDQYSIIINWSVSCATRSMISTDPLIIVTIYFQESDSTSVLKPHVTQYNIYHGFTSSITVSFDTSVTFHNVLCDTLYLIIVNAENIIGEGSNKSITICE